MKKATKIWAGAVGAVVVAGGIVAGAMALDSSSTRTMTGTLQVATFCDGGYRPGYDDIHAGTDVVVFDGRGSIIGTGQLGHGVGAGPYVAQCAYRFEVADLPGEAFYQLQIGRDARGKKTIQAAELDRPLELTLG